MSHGPERPWRDREWLSEMYKDRELTIAEMADRAGCAQSTVHEWMNKHDIERRSASDNAKINSDTPELYEKSTLEQLYWEEKLSMEKIADRIDCHPSSVYEAFQRLDIETRDFSEAVKKGKRDEAGRIPEEHLVTEYFEKERSANEIAEDLDCSGNTVLRWLQRYGYDARDPGVAANIAIPDGADHWEWRGGRVRYGNGWSPKKKRQIRQRDDFECQLCGTSNDEHQKMYDEQLHVHHIIPARMGDSGQADNSPGNLITVCRDCHYLCERTAPLLPVLGDGASSARGPYPDHDHGGNV